MSDDKEERRQRRLKQQREYWHKHGKRGTVTPRDRSALNAGFHVVHNQAGADVMEERERRLAAPHRSLTAQHFGDPPIGYSALDRMNGGVI